MFAHVNLRFLDMFYYQKRGFTTYRSSDRVTLRYDGVYICTLHYYGYHGDMGFTGTWIMMQMTASDRAFTRIRGIQNFFRTTPRAK